MKKLEGYHSSEVRERIKGLTGRKPKTRVHVQVIRELCTGCGMCVRFCPSGSWEMENNVAVWKHGMEFCLECGTCFHICKPEAVEWSYPLGGEGVIYKHG